MKRSVLIWGSLSMVLLSAFGALPAQGACTFDTECNDSNTCTDDTCDLATGYCVYTNNTGACSDVCTAVGTCQGGVCIGLTASTWNVPGDSSNTCNVGNRSCDMIQAAVNAALPGDIIVVAAGSFPENVTISKALTVLGAQAGVNGCTRDAVPLSSESVLNPANALTRFNLNAACVTVDGFTTTGGGGLQTGSPIASASAQIDRNRILNNRVLGWTGSAIFLNRGGVNISVRGNLLDSTSKVGSGATLSTNAPQTYAGFQFTDNCMLWNGPPGTYDPATGFFIDADHRMGPSTGGLDNRTPAISGNRFDRLGTGANLGSRSFTGGTISNNQFTNSNFDGLQGGIQLSSISGNTFDRNGRSGLALTSFGNTGADRGGQNSTITLNCFTNNGLRRHNGGLLFSTTQGAGLISTNQAHDNSFSGNYRAAIYGNTCSNSNGSSCSSDADCFVCAGGVNSGLPCTIDADCPGSTCVAGGTCSFGGGGGNETINAEDNYWGSPSGPNSSTNPGGTGDVVVTPNGNGGLIDMLPFSTSTTLDCPCTPMSCDDGNACTDDTCDLMSGCLFTNNTSACDDGNACTLVDVCRDGVCVCDTPPGTFTTQIDVYLDMAAAGLVNDTRFDYSSAVNGVAGPGGTCSHRRDVVFNCGYYDDTDVTGAGPRYVCSASFNAGRSGAFPKNPGRMPQSITTSGWYTFRHLFKAVGNTLVIDMDILPIGSAIPVASWSQTAVGDIVSGPGTNVGGSRYGWIASNELPFLALDNTINTSTAYNQGFETNNSGWDVLGGQYDATRVASGAGGVASAAGAFHAEAGQYDLDNDGGSAFSDWGGNRNLRCAFPTLPCPTPMCDDNNACTDDSCDPMSGCVNTPNTDPCDDGLFCTAGDICAAGICTAGGPRDCTSTSTVFVDFENPPYMLGSINGQDGWSSTGPYDQAVATNTYGYAAFGGQSLRMSNAVTSGSFGDHTFSKSLPTEVGEKTADNGGMSGGTRLGHFEAEWSFASTVPGAEQPGLSVVASPDRGDGARMSWVQMADTPAGLDVNFFDFQDFAPFGSDGNHADGCDAGGDDFIFTPVATGLDRTVPHTIRIVLDTYEGPRNDVVEVYVDGVLGHTGTSWEDYFRWCDESLPSGVSRTVDSVLFRTGGVAAPATAGQGFVIDNLTLKSGLTTDACTTAVCDEDTDSCVLVPANEGGACDDGLFCTVGETCITGVCGGGTPQNCDDSNTCTIDSCDEAGNVCVHEGSTVVTPDNLNGWAFYDDNTGLPGTGTFVAGPGTPPLRTGSARLALNGTATDRQLLTTFAYAGTRLDDITRLQYSTYRSSMDAGNLLAITMQFDMDFDLTDANTAFQGRLVFEPYLTIGSGNVPQNTWQAWTPLTGNWWATRIPFSNLCSQSSPCTWAQVLANWPDAGLRVGIGALHFKSGAPWPNFDGNVDAFSIGVNGSDTTWDFEPVAPCEDGQFCTSNDTCQNGTCVGGGPRDCTSTSTVAVDFENPPYTPGSINGQDGWVSVAACAPYDHEVDSSSGTVGFGSQSLRISNAVTSGCFDGTFSRPLPNEVGEKTADDGGLSGGTRLGHFEAQWSFASTVPGAEQPGLSVVASPDQGNGARMSWVQMADTPTGLEVNFFDYQDVAPFGSDGNHADGCSGLDDFIFAPVATGLSRTVPHTIRITLDTYEGPRNDVVKVYVDGVLGHTGTSWEDYFRWCDESLPSGVSRTVDSVMFRTGGVAAPATAGQGFVIDNLTLKSGLTTDTCTTAVCDENTDSCVLVPANEGGTCDDGLFCTVDDTCTAGVCTGAARDCSAETDQCNMGVCNETLDVCEPVPANEGGPCFDEFFCMSNDTCQNGICVAGGPRDCTTTSTVGVDFENPPYTPGSINGQDGWSSLGASGMGCAMYDHEVDSSSGTAGFGSQSLRISNAVTSGCFGDQTFSKSLPNEVGEKTADDGGLSGGTRLGHFEAEWSFASTVPGAEQPGLSVVASPDQGNGARMSWVQMADTPAGLDVNFFDFQDLAPFGSDGNHLDGCDTGGDNFFFTPVATGLSRTVPHTIRIVLDTYEGPRNDVVKVYVDGVLGHTGTSWEDYFRWCDESLPSGVSRTVDSVMFRTGGTAAPATAGQGFVIDNLTLNSGLTADACTTAVCDEDTDSCVLVPANEGGPCGDPNDGDCDNPDSCAGGLCAPNFEPGTTVCRPVAGDCDLAENCTGAGPDCPADVMITACIDDDGCCPSACTHDTDNDCGCGTCQLYGDIVPQFCLVDVDDIMCVLDDFVDISLCSGDADIAGYAGPSVCTPNGLIDVDDILGVLDSFSGIFSCPAPCPPGACVGDFDANAMTPDECRDGNSSGPFFVGDGMSESDCHEMTGGTGTYCGDYVLCGLPNCP